MWSPLLRGTPLEEGPTEAAKVSVLNLDVGGGAQVCTLFIKPFMCLIHHPVTYDTCHHLQHEE